MGNKRYPVDVTDRLEDGEIRAVVQVGGESKVYTGYVAALLYFQVKGAYESQCRGHYESMARKSCVEPNGHLY